MTSKSWTHAICDTDYFASALLKNWADSPNRVVDPDREPISEACCYCGQPTRGIYVREHPDLVHLDGAMECSSA